MKRLNDDQVAVAVRLLDEYRSAPTNEDGRTPMQVQLERDERRATVIVDQLAPLLKDYLDGRVSLEQFKTQNDSINKREEHWGFKGVKGQMFFNMVYNTAGDGDRLNRELRIALTLPSDEMSAANQLRQLAEYVTSLGNELESKSGTKSGRPKVGSVPFFVSYFWQIQDRDTWPVYYTNSVKVLESTNLWQPTGEPGADYIAYKQIHEQLAEAFTRKTGKTFNLYWVEHVFWFKGGNPFGESKPLQHPPPPGREWAATAPLPAIRIEKAVTHDSLPDSYVPPVVAVLPEMARGGEAIRKAAEA